MITRWNPKRDMVNMQSTIDRMFDDAWRPFYDNNLAMDVDETEKSYHVTVSIPGIDPEDIEVTVDNNILTIQGEVKSESEKTSDGGKRVIMRERRYGRFSRSIPLMQAVDIKNSEAAYENGVLTLELPKTEEEQTKHIKISVE